MGRPSKKYTNFSFLNVFEFFISYLNVFVLYIYSETNTKCLLITQMLDRIDLLALLLSSDEEKKQ